jgi:tetratricopeptide (TPR) repeat protein
MLKLPSIFYMSLSLLLSSHSVLAQIDFSKAQLEISAPTLSLPVFTYREQKQSLSIASHEAGFMADIRPLLAQQNYQAVADAFSGRPIDKDSPALLQLRGQVLLTLKRYADAVKVLEACTVKAPELAGAQRSLALAYVLNNQAELARKPIQQALSLGANEAALYGQLAYLNLKQFGPWSAIAGYRQALFLEPENNQWQQGLLHALTQARAYSEASALLDELINKDPEHVQWWLQGAYLALNQQQFEPALHRLETAMRYAQQEQDTAWNATNLSLLAKLHIQYGNVESGLDALDNALKLQSTSESKTLVQDVVSLSSWFAEQGDWDSLETVIALTEKYRLREAQNQMWLAYAKQAIAKKDTKNAEQRLLKGLQQEPNNGRAMLLLANLYRDTANTDSATVYYQRATAIDEVKEAAQLGLAQLYIDKRDYAQAIAMLRQVVKSNPARTELRANIKSLEVLLRHEG